MVPRAWIAAVAAMTRKVQAWYVGWTSAAQSTASLLAGYGQARQESFLSSLLVTEG
jgi:hypothetical protein